MTTIAPRGFNLKEWLESPYISPNSSTSHGTIAPIPTQIQCYALPYGLIGFISHLLTYLTMYLLSRGRDPLLPWRFIRHKIYNLVLSSLGLIITIVVTILTMIRCRNGWQLLLVATWKLTFSLTLSIMALHAATLIDWGRIKRINGAIRRTREGVTISDSRKNGRQPSSLERHAPFVLAADNGSHIHAFPSLSIGFPLLLACSTRDSAQSDKGPFNLIFFPFPTISNTEIELIKDTSNSLIKIPRAPKEELNLPRKKPPSKEEGIIFIDDADGTSGDYSFDTVFLHQWEQDV